MEFNINNIFVYVLAPYSNTTDVNISCYSDYNQSIKEYKDVFYHLKIDWKWVPITLENHTETLLGIKNEEVVKTKIIFNLCDGDEVNGTPGISVIYLLDKLKLIYTGAKSYFYEITTSKIPMKKAFDLNQIPNPKWEIINEKNSNDSNLFIKISNPLIIKPAVSGGSMGVGIKNIVHDSNELHHQYNKLKNGYRNWNLLVDGLFVESFINGPEFTIFIVGNKENVFIYPAVERVFHKNLPDEEKFLSFDRLWEIYETEKPIGDYEDFYNYAKVDGELDNRLKNLSLKAYQSLNGNGYGRVDIRMDRNTKELFVLEVNAQCGISDDENFTSIGAILKISNNSFSQLVLQILKDAYINKLN